MILYSIPETKKEGGLDAISQFYSDMKLLYFYFSVFS